MENKRLTSLILLFLAFKLSSAQSDCDVKAKIESGWLCGRIRQADNNKKYASFRGIPYAEQPLGEKRFKPLQPKKPWKGYYNATETGHICPQQNVVFDAIQQPNGKGEDCIRVNVHVPLGKGGEVKKNLINGEVNTNRGLPIVIFIHGGAFLAGSGDTDVYGPEYLVSEGVIVITFNYRLNVFGFLSLNTSEIPGNNGLRDQITLLNWVKRNAIFFGGNPEEVTLTGQSAGGASTHMLSLTTLTQGLFKRIIVMSGNAYPSFYETSPAYARYVAKLFLDHLGIGCLSSKEIHKRLTTLPLEDIMEASNYVANITGISSFVPVVESQLPGVTRVLEDDPLKLIAEGRGSNYPVIIGFTDVECQFLKPEFIDMNILDRIQQSPRTILANRYVYGVPANVSADFAKRVIDRYFNGTPTLSKFLKVCSDMYFRYPALTIAKRRAANGGAPVYIYQFKYNTNDSVIKWALDIEYTGAAHLEDTTYVFCDNKVLGNKCSSGRTKEDQRMKDFLTNVVINFVRCSKPNCLKSKIIQWPPILGDVLSYEEIESPSKRRYRLPTEEERDMIQFFNRIENTTEHESYTTEPKHVD